MPSKDRAVMNAAQRKRRQAQRPLLKALGVCRECKLPSPKRVVCQSCVQRYPRRDEAARLEKFNARKGALRRHLRPGYVDDRRQAGFPRAALGWALVLHRERHVS